MLLRIITSLFIFICTSTAWAYPNFVGFGYQSCLTCHYNPFGAGPLSDYGRAVGATVVAAKDLSSDKTTDEELGKKSGFFYSENKNDWLRPSLDYRGLYLKTNFRSESETSDFIHMDANVNVVLRLGPKDNKDKVIISSSFGYAPKPRANPESVSKEYRSREHYIGYRMTPSIGIYAGLMDKIFGIRVADHIAFSRTSTSLTQNDQSHQVMLHYTKEKIEAGTSIFFGNLSQDEEVRQKGFSGKVEYNFTPKLRAGGSLLISKSKYLEQTSMAVQGKAQFGKGNSLLAEIGQTKRTVIAANTSVSSRYLFLQNHIKTRRGLFALSTVEYFKANTDKDSEIFRWGPGIQYFPQQGIELRTDIYNTRIFSPTAVSEDLWTFTAQTHLWF